MSFIIPRASLAFPCGRKPGFDPSHVAASGCAFSSVAMPNAGCTPSLVNGTPGTLLTTAAVNRTTRFGPGFAPTTTTDGQEWSNLPNITPTAETLAAIFSITTAPSSAITVFCVGDNTSNAGTKFQVGSGTVSIATFTTSLFKSTPTSSGDECYFVVAAGNHGTANGYVMVQNLRTGKIIQLLNQASQTYDSTAGAFIIGNQPNKGNAGIGLSIHAVMASLNFYLPFPFAQQWALNPWGFWYPDNA